MLISRRELTVSVAFFLWLSVPIANVTLSSATAQIYKYTDDSGTQNFTTDLDSIPEKYRSRAIPLDHESSSASPPLVSGEQPAPSANVRVVHATGEYRMGDHDTRSDAVRLAVEDAKREALEQVATYLESVTEITNMDVTRDEIRTYTAGIVMVLDQKITTWLEEQTVVIRADLTAQVDPNEVAQAITALRENESAKNELVALRSETDQLRQQLDAANQALATAVSPEEIQALNQERQDLLNQLQTNALVSQAWTDWVYVRPVIYPYPWIGVQQVHGLLLQAQHLYPRNRHLPVLQQIVTTQAGTIPPPPPGVSSTVQPQPSLLVPPQAPVRVTPPPPQTLLPGSANAATSANALRAPAPLQQFSRPLPPTLQQVHPPHVAQPSPPVLRAPYSVPPRSPSLSPQHFGGGGGRSGGGGHGGGGHRGR
jgi:hypothetical protein